MHLSIQHWSHVYRFLKILPWASEERKCNKTVLDSFAFPDYHDDGKTPGKLQKCGKICKIYIQNGSGFPNAYFWKTAAVDDWLVKESRCVWSASGAGYGKHVTAARGTGLLCASHTATDLLFLHGENWNEGFLKQKGIFGVCFSPHVLHFFVHFKRINTNSFHTHVCYMHEGTKLAWSSRHLFWRSFLLVHLTGFMSKSQSGNH